MTDITKMALTGKKVTCANCIHYCLRDSSNFLGRRYPFYADVAGPIEQRIKEEQQIMQRAHRAAPPVQVSVDSMARGQIHFLPTEQNSLPVIDSSVRSREMVTENCQSWSSICLLGQKKPAPHMYDSLIHPAKQYMTPCSKFEMWEYIYSDTKLINPNSWEKVFDSDVMFSKRPVMTIEVLDILPSASASVDHPFFDAFSFVFVISAPFWAVFLPDHFERNTNYKDGDDPNDIDYPVDISIRSLDDLKRIFPDPVDRSNLLLLIMSQTAKDC